MTIFRNYHLTAGKAIEVLVRGTRDEFHLIHIDIRLEVSGI